VQSRAAQPALARRPDRDHGASPSSTPAAPNPLFEVEYLGLRAEPDLTKKLRAEQRNMMTAGTIDLHEVAPPEILDPR